MRNLALPATMIVLLLITACTKEGSYGVNGPMTASGEQYLLNKAIIASGEVFTVLPEGPDFDTQNLQDAFEAAIAAGPGSTVQLVEGDYYIGFVEVREFFGSFVGAGKGKTVINFKGCLDCSAFYPYNGILDDYAILIKFIGGDVYMGDMTLQTPTETLCEVGGHRGSGLAMVVFCDRSGKWDPENIYINAWVNDLDFMGGPSSAGRQWNILLGIMVQQCGEKSYLTERAHDDIKVTNCRFENFQMAISFRFLGESTIVIGENNNGNIFNNCRIVINLEDNIDLDTRIAGNQFNNSGCCIHYLDGSWGMTIYEPQTRRTILDIYQNEFNIEGLIVNNFWTNGIVVVDRRRYEGQDIPLALSIKNNLFNFSGPGYIGMQLLTTKDAVVRNNKFTGHGTVGIVGGASVYDDGTIFNSENTLVLGNNFSNSVFDGPSIALTQYTNDWTIIGGGLPEETILNLGTNNLITGVNNMDYDDAPGKTIIDNLQIIRDAFYDPD